MSVPPRARRVARWPAVALLALLALFLVVRAVVEVITVDPGRPQTYRQDWGGPHYLGVILVHTAPGLLVVVLTVRCLRKRTQHRSDRAGKGSPDQIVP